MLVRTDGFESNAYEADAVFECPDTGQRYYRARDLDKDGHVVFLSADIHRTATLYELDKEVGNCQCKSHDSLGPEFPWKEHLALVETLAPVVIEPHDPGQTTQYDIFTDGVFECPN